MYGMTPWKDEVVQYPYRYKETQNSDGTVEHEPSPGTVMQQEPRRALPTSTTWKTESMTPMWPLQFLCSIRCTMLRREKGG